MKSKQLKFLFFSLFALLFMAEAEAASGVTYHGRILKPSGAALEGASVGFRIRVLAGDVTACEIYQESHTKDMRNSGGSFSLVIGDGSVIGTYNASGIAFFDEVFRNDRSFHFLSPAPCIATPYTPSVREGRKLFVQFRESPADPWEDMPVMSISHVPFAYNSLIAHQLGSHTSASLLRVENAGAPQSISALTPANYTNLMGLLGGSGGVMTITASGNVGIGTTTPSSRLNVVGDSIFEGAIDLGPVQTGNYTWGYGIAAYPTFNHTGVAPDYGYIVGAQIWPTLGINSTGPTDQLNGIEVGVSNLGSGLVNHMSSGLFYGGATEAGSHTWKSYGVRIRPPTTTGTVDNVYGLFVEDHSGATATAHKFNLYSVGNGLNYFGGNVGVGTTSPIGRIHAVRDGSSGDIVADGIGAGASGRFIGRSANGTATAPTATQLNNTIAFFSARGYGATGFSNSASAYVSMRATENHTDTNRGTAILFGTAANGSSTVNIRMAVNNNGNVGIGTTAPAQKLSVAGNIAPDADASYDLGTSSLRFVNVYATTGVVNTSDARMKKEIRDSDLGLDFINQLRPVSYYWKKGPDKNLHYGLIAQETQRVLASQKQEDVIVTHDSRSGNYGIRYTELIAPIIRAIQEITGTTDDLREENKKLKQQIEVMKKWICAKDPETEMCR